MQKHTTIEDNILNEMIDDFINKHFTITELHEKYKFSRNKILCNLRLKNIDTTQNQAYGQNKDRGPRYSQELIDQVIDDYVNKHIMIIQLAEKYNISMSTIARWLKQNNITILNGSKYKITSIEILEKATDYYINNEVSIGKAAKTAGISKNTLRSYLQEKNLIRHRYDFTKAQINTNSKPNTKIFNHNIFANLITEDQYYWLGFIFADGVIINDTNNYSYVLKFGLAEQDKEHLEKFLKFIDALNIDIKQRIFTKNNKQFNAAEITLFSKKMVNDLIKYGCVPHKSDNGYLEWQYFNDILDEYKCAFLRGYIDGNGTIYSQYTRIKISIHSKQLAEDIHQLILSLNINAKLHYISRSNNRYIYSIEIASKKHYLQFCKMLYNNAQIYLQRKYDKYQEYLTNNSVQN